MNLRIGMGQMFVEPGHIRANTSRILRLMEKSKAAGLPVLLLPEQCVAGYLVGDQWEQSGFLEALDFAHHAISNASLQLGVDVIFGSLHQEKGARGEDGRVRKFNALFHASQGILKTNEATRAPFWPKSLLPNYRLFDDARHFFDLRKWALERRVNPEDLLAPTHVQGIPLGLTICEDGWDADYAFHPARTLARKGARLLFNSSCSPYTRGKFCKRRSVFSAQARDTGLPVLYVNAVGVQNVGKTIFGFDGRSAIHLPDGTTHDLFAPFSEGLAWAEFTSEGAFVGSGLCEGTPPMAALDPSPVEEDALALETITRWTCAQWGISRVIIGASGGIDSALAAVLFSRVLGPKNTFLVNMPTRYNSALTQNAAKALAENLGCPYASVPIGGFVQETLSQLSQVSFSQTTETPRMEGLPSENVQARDRGARILAGLAAGLGAVFPCNANKAETTVGYSTLYGDAGGFLAPLGDLWKGEVYALAKHWNAQAAIPLETFQVVPSAELSSSQDVNAGQGDPLNYPYHDALFRSFVEDWERSTPATLLRAWLEQSLDEKIGCPKGLSRSLFPNTLAFCSDLERWWKQYMGMGAFKRMQSPPVIALSKRAFGWDHREAIGSWEWEESYERQKKEALAQGL